jgi:hypothetical protein
MYPLLPKDQVTRVLISDDRLTLVVILRAVLTEMHSDLATKESVAKAWEAMKKMCLSVKSVEEENVRKLLKEFERRIQGW